MADYHIHPETLSDCWRVPPMSGSSRNYWRTLEELAETPEFAATVEREVPRFREVLGAFDRRRFLQLMAASMALGGLSACGPEPNPRQLLPYVEQPPGIVPGRSRYYATATTRDGYATRRSGRPSDGAAGSRSKAIPTIPRASAPPAGSCRRRS